MGDILTGVGITGIPAVAAVVICWIVAKVAETAISQRSDQLNSRLEMTRAQFAASLESRSALDLDLRERRERVYGPLWQAGARLSRWPRDEDLTPADLDALAGWLKNWYFADLGGLWLSAPARAAYGKLQEELAAPRADHGADPVDPDGPDYERLMAAFSALRSELTADLSSRVRHPSEVGQPPG